jgi:extradiol dioxygenase family protein
MIETLRISAQGDLATSAWWSEECSHENGGKNMKMDPAFVFHLAIPSADLDRSAEFYTGLGCRIARRYDDRVTLEFFGHQVVCHFCPDQIDQEPRMYPRHFGITFLQKTQFEYILAKAKKNQLAFFCEPFIRFKGRREEHCTFLLKDPSNNLLEFKYYDDSAMVY